MLIPTHPSQQILDSSKFDTAERCWRKFFFEYLLGWRLDNPNHDLYFGSAWHIAREYQLIHGYEEVPNAYLAFMDYYRKEFPQETDEIYTPKDPLAVGYALNKFADEKQNDLRDNELLFTETSGTVPIDHRGRVLHYRMDSILRHRETGMVFSWDHKTTKAPFYWMWEEQFQLGLQNGTYTHCLYCQYPVEEVSGIEFCGTGFQFLKRNQEYKIELKRVPAYKTPDQMNNWLWTVNMLYDDYERNMEMLDECQEGDAILMAFPMNGTSCTDFGRICAYHDYCIAWPNPLQRCSEPPLGFKTEWWDPSKMETTNKKNLEWR